MSAWWRPSPAPVVMPLPAGCAPARLQPTAPKSRPAQSRDHRGAPAHDVPQQAGAEILYHQCNRSLVDAKMERRDPPAGRTIGHGEGWLQAVFFRHAQIHLGKIPQGRDDDFRRKWQRGGNHPGRNGSVVRTERGPARVVTEKLTFNAADQALFKAGPITGGKTPAMFAIAFEIQRIADGVFLLHECRLPAVLEI